MLEAYACLGAALAEEQAAAERAAAHEQLSGGRARSLSLGRDRAGASYWAIGPRAPLSVWVEPSPRGGQRGGGAAGWRRCVGLAAVEALAASLDARGAAERSLQKSLWRLCDDSLRAEHDAAAAPSRAALESLLPPFEPAPPPAPPAGLAIHEHAESLPGGLLAAE
ncbi:hypothetical protein EMIHUDRAFT_471758, partial [Emiliania huxleyi CCMP1516]|uniref:WHIM2 domain-containing protein n=2 Tax=Emiliania huxleyi TaxID=2903 RepID=A0A0D3IRV7_EMIH1